MHIKNFSTVRILAAVLGAVSVAALGAANLGREKGQVRSMLDNVLKTVQANFYDPALRGLDWKALTAQTEGRIEAAGSLGDMFAAVYWQVDQLQDSHTKFVPPPRVTKFLFGFEVKAFGDEVRVYELDEKGAAAAAGLRKGDRILTYNGFTAERASLDLMLIYFRLLKPVAAVEIEYVRGNEAPRKVLVEGRRKDGLKVVDLTGLDTIYRLIREAENEKEIFRYDSYEEGRVGYLQIPSFTVDRVFINRLIDRIEGSRVVILDLRGNLGGSVESLEHMLGFFEGQPVEVAQMLERKKTKAIKARASRKALEVPLVILVDSQTASAAEVMAHHFQRTGRAVVIGDRTSGQVSVSRVFPLRLGTDVVIAYAAQVTVARLEFPGGESLEGRGVTPDQPCLPSAADLAEDADPCLEQARELARQKVAGVIG